MSEFNCFENIDLLVNQLKENIQRRIAVQQRDQQKENTTLHANLKILEGELQAKDQEIQFLKRNMRAALDE